MAESLIPVSSLEADEIIALEQRLEKYDGHDRIVSSDDLRVEFSSRKKNSRSFATGISGLDRIIKNIESGELIAVGGPTKNGKTLLCQTMTANMARAGVGCLWFTFEVPAAQFLDQMPNTSAFFMPRELKQSSLVWLRDRILEGKLKKDTRVVFVDNLHHLLDFTTVRNVSLDLGVIIRALKRMAIDLNVAILVLCHSKKPDIGTNGIPREVSEWDLRDSSFIPQECDSTIMVQRMFDKELFEAQKVLKFGNKTMVKVCLHRRTGAMGEYVQLRKEGNFLVEDSPEPVQAALLPRPGAYGE
jgi:hypothetical protein